MNPALNKSDERLQAALRSLSDNSQAEPSPELGTAVMGAFRRHHARRRFRRRAAAVAVLFVASSPVLFLLRSNHRPQANAGNDGLAATGQPQPVVSPPTVATATATTPHRRQRTGRSARRANLQRPLEFVALPAYAGSGSTGDARIIRLELSGRALRMVGAPVNPEDESRQVLADFVVGQDGIPYAVRLVR